MGGLRHLHGILDRRRGLKSDVARHGRIIGSGDDDARGVLEPAQGMRREDGVHGMEGDAAAEHDGAGKASRCCGERRGPRRLCEPSAAEVGLADYVSTRRKLRIRLHTETIALSGREAPNHHAVCAGAGEGTFRR